MTQSSGRMVTETLAFDGGRDVSVFVPDASPRAIVYAGDGPLVAAWGERLASRTRLPIMIVATHALDDETARIREYSPGRSTLDFTFDPARFAAHEAFFVHQVPRWVAERFGVALPADRVAVFGASAGAELALAVGLRHPDRFGAVLCASPGAGFQPDTALTGPLPRAYFVAGDQEPFFVANAARWATALRDAGGDVISVVRAGEHGGAFWEQELPAMVDWAFGSVSDASGRTDRGPR